MIKPPLILLNMVKRRPGMIKTRQEQGALPRWGIEGRHDVGHGQVFVADVRNRQHDSAIPCGHEIIDTQSRCLIGASELNEILGGRALANEICRESGSLKRIGDLPLGSIFKHSSP